MAIEHNKHKVSPSKWQEHVNVGKAAISPRISTGQLGQKRGRLEAIQDNNRADQKHSFIGDNLVQIGPLGKNNPWWKRILTHVAYLSYHVYSRQTVYSENVRFILACIHDLIWVW